MVKFLGRSQAKDSASLPLKQNREKHCNLIFSYLNRNDNINSLFYLETYESK